MSILTRYVLREFVSAWLIVLSALSVMLCGSQFARALERATDAHLPNDIVPQLVIATFVQALPIIGPLSLTLGIVLVIGRLCHDGEFSAMRAAGIGLSRVARPIVLVAIGFALVLGWLALEYAPSMASREQALLADGLRRAQLAAFQPGRFTQLPDSATVVHVRARGADGMLQQLVIARSDGTRIEVITARRAMLVSNPNGRGVSIIAYDGLRAEGIPGEGIGRQIHFASLTTQVALDEVRRVRTSRDFLPSAELWESARPDDAAELHWRWSLPVMCVILVLIVLPLAILRPRQGRYARVLPVLLVFFLYINALIAARTAMAHSSLSNFPGMWLVHAMFAVIAVGVGAWPMLRRKLATYR